MSRTAVSLPIKLQVLTEAGYRCAIPTCRNILALDLHHIIEVKDGGLNDAENLIALCPTCHALYTRGTITKEAIDVYKGLLVSLNGAFAKDTINNLAFLSTLPVASLGISGDGVLKFSDLIGSGLATFKLLIQNGPLLLYEVSLTDKGRRIVNAWKRGDRNEVLVALS